MISREEGGGGVDGGDVWFTRLHNEDGTDFREEGWSWMLMRGDDDDDDDDDDDGDDDDDDHEHSLPW